MKNTKIHLLGMVLLLALISYQCDCPKCPQNSNDIIIDDVDTVSFMIVTDDADTVSVKVPIPKVQRLDSIFRYSIIIDDIDTTHARIVTDDADATRKVDIITKPKDNGQDPPAQQGQ